MVRSVFNKFIMYEIVQVHRENVIFGRKQMKKNSVCISFCALSRLWMSFLTFKFINNSERNGKNTFFVVFFSAQLRRLCWESRLHFHVHGYYLYFNVTRNLFSRSLRLSEILTNFRNIFVSSNDTIVRDFNAGETLPLTKLILQQHFHKVHFN